MPYINICIYIYTYMDVYICAYGYFPSLGRWVSKCLPISVSLYLHLRHLGDSEHAHDTWRCRWRILAVIVAEGCSWCRFSCFSFKFFFLVVLCVVNTCWGRRYIVIAVLLQKLLTLGRKFLCKNCSSYVLSC